MAVRPEGRHLEPALQGCKMRGGEYEALPAAERGAGRLVLCSAVLGLELRLEAGEFRFHDAATGTMLGIREELEARLREETGARQREAAARRVAEVRVGGPSGGRQEGLREGELKGEVLTIEGFLGRDAPWSTIEAATGIDEATFRRLKHQVEAADDAIPHPN